MQVVNFERLAVEIAAWPASCLPSHGPNKLLVFEGAFEPV